ncbi:MAG: phosphoribosyl-AMP cyclohydrolase [Hydrotalea sp.]|nr:phosphoribosyl-AMP cyclohydrolase [Hydrotalea sp.]
MRDDEFLAAIKFDDRGLVPVVVQAIGDNMVLMQAFMNRDAVTQTLQTGRMVFWSRSRNELWVKGATSGHYQHWQELLLDCDGDSLLARVTADGPACHLGTVSCFQRKISRAK